MNALSRGKKAIYNGITGLIFEIITIVSGLILPRIILNAFGSNYNGVTQSITQFLSFVILLRAGVGAVTKAALYSPLAKGEYKKINSIIRATEIFMKKISIIFAIGLVVMAIVYPFLVIDEFEWFFSSSLVLIIGIGTFVQYYFGITYQMLLEADQCQYIISIISICTTLMNLIFSVILIQLGCGIHLIKIVSTLIFSFNPIVLNIIVKRKYKIKKNIEPDNTAIKQRWDAFAQQVATMIRDNTDIVILTIVSNTKEVSVYTVYFMVIKAINSIIRAFTNGIGAAFGNMFANNEKTSMLKNLRIYELIVYSLASILYTSTYLLITPFVLIYTNGIVDVNYNRPIFGYILSIAYMFFCIRIPYQNMVEVAGHFKQTKKGAYVEAFINLIISILLGYKFGIVGVATGTLIAMAFRTIQYSIYVAKNIVIRSQIEFIKRIICSILNILFIILICNKLIINIPVSFLSWILCAMIVFSISIIVTFLFDIIFYKNEVKNIFVKIKLYIKK